jgi:hypothetical protein
MGEADQTIRELFESGDTKGAATATIKVSGPQVLRYLRSILRDEEDVRDAFSAFAEAVWKGLPGFRWDASLATWSYSRRPRTTTRATPRTIARRSLSRQRSSPRGRRRGGDAQPWLLAARRSHGRRCGTQCANAPARETDRANQGRAALGGGSRLLSVAKRRLGYELEPVAVDELSDELLGRRIGEPMLCDSGSELRLGAIEYGASELAGVVGRWIPQAIRAGGVTGSRTSTSYQRPGDRVDRLQPFAEAGDRFPVTLELSVRQVLYSDRLHVPEGRSCQLPSNIVLTSVGRDEV